VRNTLQQLKSTVKPIIDTWLVTMPKGTLGGWQITDHTFMMRCRLPDGSVVNSDFLMMPADTPDDVRRLLSLEVSDAWIEEGREIVQEIVEGITGRVGRYPSMAMGGCTYPGMVISTNAPPLGGYWHSMITKPPANWEVFMQPPAILEDGNINPGADNLDHLPVGYYANLMEASPASGSTFTCATSSAATRARPCTATRPKGLPRRQEPATAVPQSAIAGGGAGQWPDGGLRHHAARPARRANAGECYVPEGVTMGFETHMDKLLIPAVNVLLVPPREHRSCATGLWAPLDDERTIADAIRQRGYTVYLAPHQRPSAGRWTLSLPSTAAPASCSEPTHPLANAMGRDTASEVRGGSIPRSW
jgi:hypothetical protein